MDTYISRTCLQVSIQYLEIYNESLYDLLDITTQPHEINIYEAPNGGVRLAGLRSQAVSTEADALSLLFEVRMHGLAAENHFNCHGYDVTPRVDEHSVRCIIRMF